MISEGHFIIPESPIYNPRIPPANSFNGLADASHSLRPEDCDGILTTVSGKTLLCLEGQNCFWKDTTVSGGTKLFLKDKTVYGRAIQFLEGQHSFWKYKMCFWKDQTVSGRTQPVSGRINQPLEG